MSPIPDKIQLHKQSKILALHFGTQVYQLSAEYLRTHSPSAEVKGHGSGQATLQYGKKEVGISGIERAGNYALRFIFDDGHNTGIYTWRYLYDLSINYEHHWRTYIDALSTAGKSREQDTSIIKFV